MREGSSAPGRIVLRLQILANMHEREDVDDALVLVDGIDHALTLHDELADVVYVGFGNLPPNAGQPSKLDDRIEDAIDEAFGINR